MGGRFTALEYQSRLTISHGRWTHLISPSLLWKQGLSDRFLQHINYESLGGAWETYAMYRLASRTQARAELRYEAIQDYTPGGDRQAWEVQPDGITTTRSSIVTRWLSRKLPPPCKVH